MILIDALGERLKRIGSPAPRVAVMRLHGPIMASRGFRGLSIEGLAGTIERAFALKRLKAVALLVNSPGGSPVQSALIAKRIRDLAQEKKVPVFAFAEDVAASGGYWLLTAGDELFANESSIVGSIGVVSAGFGFPDFIRRFGIERRLHTSGERKVMLDPFRPERQEDVERLKRIQSEIHTEFKAEVRRRRGAKLKADEESLFDGSVWTGRQALEMGLIDGIGDLRTVMRERYGERVKLVPVGRPRSWLQRRLGIMAGPEELWLDRALDALEERLLWSRYGL